MELNSYSQIDLLVVLDGARTVEKAGAHLKRTESLAKAFLKLETLVKQLIASDIKKYSRAIHKTVDKKIKATKSLTDFVFPSPIITCTARGEADVYLGTLAESVVRISGDSDTLYYSNTRLVARPVRNGKTIMFKVFYLLLTTVV